MNEMQVINHLDLRDNSGFSRDFIEFHDRFCSYISSIKDSNSALRLPTATLLLLKIHWYLHILKASQTFGYSTAVCGACH